MCRKMLQRKRKEKWPFIQNGPLIANNSCNTGTDRNDDAATTSAFPLPGGVASSCSADILNCNTLCNRTIYTAPADTIDSNKHCSPASVGFAYTIRGDARYRVFPNRAALARTRSQQKVLRAQI